MKRIAIFSSGEGTNANKLIEYFEDSNCANVVLLVSNRPNSGGLKIAKKHDVESLIVLREEFMSGVSLIEKLIEREIDYIVLAGFLWLLPPNVIVAFSNKIINVHPSLLPKFGGKGMYGTKVHEAVIAAKEIESGITIHYVNEKFDEGKHIAQFKCAVLSNDTAETLNIRVRELEHQNFAKVLESLLF